MHGKLDRGFLHPGGRHATERMLSLLPPLSGTSVVVELGCGVGETANLILSQFPCSYVGIDSSLVMLNRTRSRVRRFQERARLLQVDLWTESIPLPDGHADILIAESVIAILEPEKIFREAHRILKKGGWIAWNDRIWGNEIEVHNRRTMNEEALRLFGSGAAAETHPTSADWKNAAERAGFRMTVCERVDGTSVDASTPMSKLTTLMRLATRPRYLLLRYYDRFIEQKYGPMWKQMENWLFVGVKE
jgi:ubiquinone/menaquinone biosynthesis C-methylase UbiE